MPLNSNTIQLNAYSTHTHTVLLNGSYIKDATHFSVQRRTCETCYDTRENNVAGRSKVRSINMTQLYAVLIYRKKLLVNGVMLLLFGMYYVTEHDGAGSIASC